MSLKVWLPLNGNLTQQGTSGVSMINSNATINTSGKIGSCYYFNASSYLYENTYDWTNFNTSQFSLCCWYKQPSPVASGNSQIICIGTSSGWNNIRIGLLRRTSNGYPMFSVSNGSSAVQYNCTATTFSFDTWNHIVCTYNNGTIKIYLNGILNKTYTTTIVPVLNNSQHLGVGAASNGAEKLTGYLNDVRIYDHCLSAAEVREISHGLVCHYKLDNIENNIAIDSSGYSHNGIIVNNPVLVSNSIRYSQGLQFNGTNQYIRCGRGGMVTDAITVAWWGSMESWSGYKRAISCTESGGWNFEPSSSCINFACGTGTSSNTYKSAASVTTLASLTSGWHFFVGTYDGFQTKIYIDGQLEKTNNAYSTKTPLKYHASNGIFIGAEAGGNATTPAGTYFNGILSDIRIYATALSAEDIKQLYQLGAKIDNQQNLHTYEINEIFDESESNISASWTSDVGPQYTVASYGVAVSPPPTTERRYIQTSPELRISNSLPISLNIKYILNQTSSVILKTITYSYVSTSWRKSGSSYTQVTNSRLYGRMCRYRILVNFYDLNDNLLTTRVISSNPYGETNLNSSYTAINYTFTISDPMEIVIDPSNPNEVNASYITITREYIGQTLTNLGTLSISQGTNNIIKLYKTGVFKSENFIEADNAKIFKSKEVSANQFIEC